MLHPRPGRNLWLSALIATALAACGDDAGGAGADDAGTDTGGADAGVEVGFDVAPDTGGGGTCTDTYRQATTHESYVPQEQCPTDAARVVFMGDSITAGAGAPPGLTYLDLLVRNDDEAYADEAGHDLETLFGEIEVVDVSVGGATTEDLASSQIRQATLALGDTVSGHTLAIMTIGGNDFVLGALNPGSTLSRVIENLETMVEFFRDETRFPDGVSIYVKAVYEPSDGVGQAAGCFGGADLSFLISELTQWRESYIDLGVEHGFAVVDALSAFHGHGFYSEDEDNEYHDSEDPTLWFASDCIHPNERGHHEIRRLFYEVISRGDYIAD